MWSDSETLNDYLGYRSYVPTLAEVCQHPELAPLALGIFGAWGSGKSSLMQMLKAHIDESTGKASPTQTLWFNAWRYENRDEAQSALIHTILGKLEENRTLGDKAKNLLTRLKEGASILKLAKFITTTAVTLTPDIGGFIDCFKEQSAKVANTMEHFEQDFRELLENVGVKRLVIFIDDLDRCQNAKIIEIFETIKLFLDIPATTFVLGADVRTITEAVGAVHGVTDERRQKDYLEKIIQIPFNIPEQKLADISCFVGMLIINAHILPDHQAKLVEARSQLYTPTGHCTESFCAWLKDNAGLFEVDAMQHVETELRQILDYAEILARGLRGNPRQIKRFLNILSLRQRLAAANNITIDPALMVKLGVIEYVWENIFRTIAETIDPATGQSLLLAALHDEGSKEDDSASSELLQQAREDLAFIEFIHAEPPLDGKVDLRDYLYLAQTALGAGRVDTLIPADEQAKQLVADIESTDRLRSRAGAMRAASSDAAVASAVARRLGRDLCSAGNPALQVGIIQGLHEVCRRHPSHFTLAVDTLRHADLGKAEGVAVACTLLLRNASKAGVEVEPDLAKRFEDVSPISKALAPKPGKKSNRGT
jgi:predicted KAP-like P-loop ATPase